MNEYKIAICQINLILKDYKINNIDEHVNKVKKCLEIVRSYNVQFVVFPEYSFCDELIDLYNEYSKYMIIIGGSYLCDSYNQTVIAYDQRLNIQKKKNLSPYEINIVSSSKVKASEEKNILYYADKTNVTYTVLTCLDYYRLINSVAMNEPNIDIVFSPSCNDNQQRFFTAAEAAHDQRASIYSVQCNASDLVLLDSLHSETKKYGESFIFGFHDKLRRNELLGNEFTDKNYRNMILKLPDGENIGIATLQIPYHSYPPGSVDYKPNPVYINVLHF
jgi:predicted amidohydrolase